MNESALDKLKRKAKKKKLDRKAEPTKKKQVEKEKTKYVCLIGAIYIKLLALREPTTKELKVFE
jgi:hypothetical protein